ncbi:MAG: hypothetical protein M3P08_07540 [Thermoproteota archaeon]|nr:hypothetical protein [Thermoproteota archaeon]
MQNATAQENSTNIMPPTSTNGNNTADKLLTYNSSSYWISIQYPSSWIKEELQNQSSGEIVKFSSLPGTPPMQLRISDGVRIVPLY